MMSLPEAARSLGVAAATPITADEALTLSKYDPIYVKRPHGRRRLAVVTERPRRVAEWVIVTFSHVEYANTDQETMRGHSVAILGGTHPDEVTRR